MSLIRAPKCWTVRLEESRASRKGTPISPGSRLQLLYEKPFKNSSSVLLRYLRVDSPVLLAFDVLSCLSNSDNRMQTASCNSRYLPRSQTASLRALQANNSNKRQAQTGKSSKPPVPIARYLCCQTIDSPCPATGAGHLPPKQLAHFFIFRIQFSLPVQDLYLSFALTAFVFELPS